MSKCISIIGCGWMGLPCAEHLVKAGYQVKGSTTTSVKLPSLKDAGINAFLLDLDRNEVPAELLDCDILFINFPPGRGVPDLVNRYMQRITKVIETAKIAGVQKIIFASSTGVYQGDSVNDAIDETASIVPKRESAQALYTAELALSLYTDQLTILRFAGLVGGTRHPAKFLAGKKDIPNPDNAVNLIHLEDCVAIIHQLIAQDIFGATLNAVADQHPTRKEYYTAQSTKADLTPPTFASVNTAPNKIALNTKLKETLGYEFLHPDPAKF